MNYAVVDLETTGVYNSDRVLEIAVVVMDENGDTLDEYESLVNPERDVGPTHVHGVEPSDLVDAPTFPEIVGDVIERLDGAIFVAHNVSFDNRFLRRELERARVRVPGYPCLCTMRAAKELLPVVTSRSLRAVCDFAGIDISDAHSAIEDARATAGLLAWFFELVGPPPGLRPDGTFQGQWPSCSATRRARPRSTGSGRPESPIRQLLRRLPPTPVQVSPALDDYYFLLDRVLEDRIITPEESSELESLAVDLGLGREDIVTAHRLYLQELVSAALRDGVISQTEAFDLQTLQALLDVSDLELQRMIEAGRCLEATRSQDWTGHSICFSGEFRGRLDGEPIQRRLAEEVARAAGMVVKSGVSKSLDFLVLRDPHSMSGKAKKAREYGTRILAEPVFWRMMGIQVE